MIKIRFLLTTRAWIIDLHLLALLDERRERISQVLHEKSGVVS